MRNKNKMLLIHIHSLIAFKNSKGDFIAEAADILLKNLNRRLPLSEEIIASAIVDPSTQHVEAVGEWIHSHNTAR